MNEHRLKGRKHHGELQGNCSSDTFSVSSIADGSTSEFKHAGLLNTSLD